MNLTITECTKDKRNNKTLNNLTEKYVQKGGIKSIKRKQGSERRKSC